MGLALRQDCPCGTGLPYDACCGRLHRGAAAAITAEELMRSRYAAYAVGDLDHVFRTDDDHGVVEFRAHHHTRPPTGCCTSAAPSSGAAAAGSTSRRSRTQPSRSSLSTARSRAACRSSAPSNRRRTVRATVFPSS
ncbi:MAG: YchJ family metal-binding protein [Nocardioides sp.]